jgi:hypothetical protein
MTASRPWVFAAAVAILLPAASSAQSIDFGVQCTTGSLRACASVRAWNELDVTTGDFYLYVRVANVQGWSGFQDLTTSGLATWRLSGLSAYNFTGTAAELLRGFVDEPQNAGVGGEGTYRCWRGECESGSGLFSTQDYNLNGDEEVTFSAPISHDGGTTIHGCDVPQFGHSLYSTLSYSTCDGSVTYRLNPGYQPSLGLQGSGLALTSNTELYLNFWAYDSADDSECSTGASTAFAECAAVVPEPITMILMGTGLLGIGGARAARRRRKLFEAD